MPLASALAVSVVALERGEGGHHAEDGAEQPDQGRHLGDGADRADPALECRQLDDRGLLDVEAHRLGVVVRVEERGLDDRGDGPGRLLADGQRLHQPALGEDVLDPAQEGRRADLPPVEVEGALDEDDDEDQPEAEDDPDDGSAVREEAGFQGWHGTWTTSGLRGRASGSGRACSRARASPGKARVDDEQFHARFASSSLPSCS
jgi:hypothetical protein